MECHSYKEIAIKLNISEENVRKRIQEARTVLRQSFKTYLAGDQTNGSEVKKPNYRFLSERLKSLSQPCLSSTKSQFPKPRKSPVSSTWLIKVHLPNKIQKQFYRSVQNSHHRIRQKIKTLSLYVTEHSRRLEERTGISRIVLCNR